MHALKVSQYDDAEALALTTTPNYVVWAFQALIFQSFGFPTKILTESELLKYVDTMHERRFDHDFETLIGAGLTEGEFKQLSHLNRFVADFTEKKFSQRRIALNSTLRSLHIIRQLECLFGNEQKFRVFEVGPGCGYLGALLLMQGHTYAATDITQAFYLYQNHLWNFIANQPVIELLDGNTTDFSSCLGAGSAVHLPWWTYSKLRPGNIPEFDLVTANHALCEMNNDSLRFTVRVAKEMLRGEGAKAFVFESWGWDVKNSQASVCEVFTENGFLMVHNDAEFTIFVPKQSEFALGHFPFPAISRKQDLKVQDNQLVLAEIEEKTFAPPPYTSTSNPFSLALVAGRQANLANRTVKKETLVSEYQQILSGQIQETGDEEFWNFIGKAKG